MERIAIKCARCGQKDFSVTKTMIPHGIQLECKCGGWTPIAFFDEKENIYTINGEEEQKQYERTFTEKVTPEEAEAAARFERRKQEIYNRIMKEAEKVYNEIIEETEN